MAIYHFDVKNVSRGLGSSAVARAAYISRDRLRDERLRQSFDFRARGGLEHSEILLPAQAGSASGEWARDRQNLWNVAEAAETRANARVAREYVVALPHELSAAERLSLARGFAQSVADRHAVIADLAVHRPPEGGDPRNHHAHVLATTREFTAEGLGAKTPLSYTDTRRREAGLTASAEEIRRLRHDWAERVNEQLRAAKLDLSVDARSYWERGSSRVPERHLGPKLIALERSGVATDVVARYREEHASQQRLMTAFAEEHAKSLAAREPAREAAVPPRPLTLEERQQLAVARWLDYRREQEAGHGAGAKRELERARDLGPELEI